MVLLFAFVFSTQFIPTVFIFRFSCIFRVVQRNLVFVVGLSQRLADQDVLRRVDYFGKYGKIHKVVINQSTSYAGAQVIKIDILLNQFYNK